MVTYTTEERKYSVPVSAKNKAIIQELSLRIIFGGCALEDVTHPGASNV